MSVSESPPRLDPSTLALLDSFLASRAEEEQRFNALSEQARSRVATGDEDDSEETSQKMMSVDEYRLAFGEDWQLSQFWYTTAFANKLARHLHALCTPSTKIAFLCCPTAFVAFQHMEYLDGARLLEFDQRFGVLSPSQFIRYDLEEPDVFPETLRGTFDVAIADPPFLNERTNHKVAQTLRQILCPTRGKMFLITSTSIESVLDGVYKEPPIGPLRRTVMKIEHEQLANAFASWGSWIGAEEFGKEEKE